MECASTVVIKLKYGNVLRRLNAQIVDEQLDLSINELKETTLSLFGLARETEIMLTYIDEDGDMVTLVDADDLRDAVKQGLNPVRIIVKVVSENNAGRLNKTNLSSVESIPVKFPQLQQNLPSSGFLRSFPEQLLLSYKSQTTDTLNASGDVHEKGPAEAMTKDACMSKFNDVVANSNIGENLGDFYCVVTEKEVGNQGPKTENYTASDAKDYLDRPVVPRKHLPYKIQAYWDIHEPHMSFLEAMMQVQQISTSKLGACFIEDVTLKTGTIMGPLTEFTKIWRMRNCGEIAWPQKTRLVCASRGGFNRYSVELEIPAGGVPVGGDLDIAVDLVAPPVSGRYISFWSMVSSGSLFGPRVSVLIQVDASIETGTITANVEPIVGDSQLTSNNPMAMASARNPTPIPVLAPTLTPSLTLLSSQDNLAKLKEVKELLHRSSAKTCWIGKAHPANTQFWAPAPTLPLPFAPYLHPPCNFLGSKSYEEQLKLMQTTIQTQLQRLEDLQQLQHGAIKTCSQAQPEPTPLAAQSLISQRYLELIDWQNHMQLLMQEMKSQLLREQQQQQQLELSKLAARPINSDLGVDASTEAGTVTANVEPVVGGSQPEPNNQIKVRPHPPPTPTIAPIWTPALTLLSSQSYHEPLKASQLSSSGKTYGQTQIGEAHLANTQNEPAPAPAPAPAPTSSTAPTSMPALNSYSSQQQRQYEQMKRQYEHMKRQYAQMQEQQRHQFKQVRLANMPIWAGQEARRANNTENEVVPTPAIAPTSPSSFTSGRQAQLLQHWKLLKELSDPAAGTYLPMDLNGQLS